MIVPMSKVHIVVRSRDRDRLLTVLRDLGMVHLVPVDPNRAVADEAVTRQVDMIKRALQVLSGIKAQGSTPELTPVEAAQEVIDIERRAAEGRSHLAALYHQLDELQIWGDLRLEHLEQLGQAGIDVAFYSMPAAESARVEGQCVAVVGELPGRQVLVAVASRSQEPKLPPLATRVNLPVRDAPSIRADAKQIDAALHQDIERLHALATLIPRMRTELVRLEQQSDEMVAMRSAVADQDLFALQGWLPFEKLAVLRDRLVQQEIPLALEVLEPGTDEDPPTLVRPPAWARPIEGLFGMLGTIPGYREFDISIPFLIALPIFTAMLISDGGYGALLVLVIGLGYRPISKVIGTRFSQLMLIVGAVSLAWGILANAFFGYELLPWTLIPINQSEASRTFMMRLSFTIGAIHLSLAQLWQAVRVWPDLRAANKIGWALFVWGMYGVVVMFVLKGPMGWHTPWPYLLLVGAALAILFAQPSRNLAKMLLLGVAEFPLSMLSAFSDVISYVRLMAVGLASGVLAVSFNSMAADAAWPLAILIFVFGHSLNIALAMIAMFAHGVRLNMLEFSNNLGMRWTGFPYQPFTQRSIQEHT